MLRCLYDILFHFFTGPPLLPNHKNTHKKLTHPLPGKTVDDLQLITCVCIYVSPECISYFVILAGCPFLERSFASGSVHFQSCPLLAGLSIIRAVLCERVCPLSEPSFASGSVHYQSRPLLAGLSIFRDVL